MSAYQNITAVAFQSNINVFGQCVLVIEIIKLLKINGAVDGNKQSHTNVILWVIIDI